MSTKNRAAVIVRAREAEQLEAPVATIQLLADASATGNVVSIHRTKVVEGGPSVTPHHHLISSEMFLVLDGVFEFMADDELSVLHPGDFAIVPPKCVHAFGPAPEHAVEFLCWITPGVDRFDMFRSVMKRAAIDSTAFDTYDDESSIWDAAHPPAG